MLTLIKSILKSLELFLALKNKQFYYDLHNKHKKLEYEIIAITGSKPNILTTPEVI